MYQFCVTVPLVVHFALSIVVPSNVYLSRTVLSPTACHDDMSSQAVNCVCVDFLNIPTVIFLFTKLASLSQISSLSAATGVVFDAKRLTEVS